jgi:hypothetical protein
MRVGMRQSTCGVAFAVGLLTFILVVLTCMWLRYRLLGDAGPISLEAEAFEATSDNLRGPGTAVLKCNTGPWSEFPEDEYPANWIHYDYATIGVSKDGILIEPISAEWRVAFQHIWENWWA